MARRAESATGPFVAVAAALATAGATAATWVSQPATRAVGDVAVVETRATEGTEIAPLALVAGLGGLLLALALFATRGTVRRIVALLLVVAGAVALGSVGVAIPDALAAEGTATAWPWIAAASAVALVGSGLWTFGRPGRRMAPRYDVGGPTGDEEWQMASDTPPADGGGQ
jgi:hypothetical protein